MGVGGLGGWCVLEGYAGIVEGSVSGGVHACSVITSLVFIR